jgi:hypothetical protein
MPNLKAISQTVLCVDETFEPTEYDTIICQQSETEQSLWS